MTWLIWVSFAAISAANIVTPGPANLNTVRRAAQLGFVPVFPTIMGNALGLAVGGVLCAGGVASFVLASEWLWTMFRWFGVAYLAWLGLKLIIRKEELAPGRDETRPISGPALFGEAFVLAATNPKAILFYVALFPQVLNPDAPLAPQAGLLVLTYCVLSILSLSTYAAITHLLRARFMSQKRYDRFRLISGIVLLGFAGKLAQQAR